MSEYKPLDDRQVINRAALSNIGSPANDSLDDIFARINTILGNLSGGSGYIAKNVALTSGTTSLVVTIPAQQDTSFVVLAMMGNLVDSSPQYQQVLVSNKTVTGFTFEWNNALDTSNYFISYVIPFKSVYVAETAITSGVSSFSLSLPTGYGGQGLIAQLQNTVDSNPQFQSVIVGSSVSSNTPTQQIFLSGSGTYVTPANVDYIVVKMVGGGGGGGGGGSSNAGGGGAGNYMEFTVNSPASVYSYSVGAGGAGGTGGGAGHVGVSTVFGTNTANPGSGGTGSGGAGGAAGTLSLGTGISLAGGGGVAQPIADNTSTILWGGGAGGSSAFGGGGHGTFEGTSTGIAAPANTGAGGGAVGYGGSTGGAGGSGVVIVEEYYFGGLNATSTQLKWNVPTDSANYKAVFMVAPTSQIAISNGTTSVTIPLPINYGTSNYAVLASTQNTMDASPQFQPLLITNQTDTSVTISWNVPRDSGNYLLNYYVISLTV